MIAPHASVSLHAWAWPRIRPNASPPTASAATSAPSQSNRPVASESRDSSTWRSVTHSAKAVTGTLMRKALRQPMVSTIVPPTIGPSTVSAEVEAAHMPKARPRSAPENACVISDSDPGTQQRAGAALHQAEDDQPLERRREAAQRGRGPEPGQADGEDRAAAVVVGQAAGEDQQGREDRQVAADDVGLALERADVGRGQVLRRSA